ncbi:FRAS1-related extracellular matrix protein 1-like [Neolamprologus brichardi]|uniref:FRAS1-related extracellular matrix protein 1-like n=1 Tax=Neolamprologus brichardi TaxID=32507 RepID=UPI001643AA21|nr:FRAS1-related extracellular matrix protein 1-like [Neolamprologus brichardi]
MEPLSLLLQSPSSLQSGGFLWVDAIELNSSHDTGSGPSLSCQHAADPSGFHLSLCKRLSRNHSSYLIFTELRITFWATGAHSCERVQKVKKTSMELLQLQDLEDFLCGKGAVAGIQREQWRRVGAALEYLLVRVVDSGEGVVALGSAPLVVPQFYGLSNAINGSVLNIRAAPDLVCTVRLLTADTSVPAAGRLVREEDSTQRKGRQATLCPGNSPCLHDTTEVRFLKTSCHEFLSSGLKYQHLSPPSPEIDYVPVRVELREQASRALLESQAVWLPVLIHGAMQNQPPQATFMASFILEVDQFILTPLTTATLDAKDHETPQEKLVFNVTVPPAEGYITHLDDHTKPIRSFTWLDLHEMKVAYQPSNSSRGRRRNYEVEFQVIDGSYLTSPPIVVHVSIRTSETNAPRVSWNVGLDLLEGQSRPITWEQLQIVDSDNIDAVYLVAVDGPVHGRLSVRGLDLLEGQSRPITWEQLQIVDSDNIDAVYLVAVDGPVHGRLSVRGRQEAPSWQPGSRREGRHVVAHRFSQRRPSQRLAVPPGANTNLLFPSDNGRKAAHVLETTVVVHVFPVEDQVPVEVPGSVRSLTVKETEVVYITQAHLHFTDREHPDADLTYVITQPCFSSLHPGLMDAGRLFYTDSTNAMKKDHTAPVLKSFTQHAVNHMKVAFMPPVEDIGPESLFVQFIFSVSDHHGDTVSGLIFNITVTPVDDQAPEAFTNLLRVEEGGAAFVTEEHLLVRDRDSREEALRVEVRSTARHGRLELRGRALQQGGGFTLQELRGLGVRYIHDDSETTEDVVGLKVSDGLNSVDVVLHVQVLPMNDEPPQLGTRLQGGLSCEEGGRVQVTVDYLSATDRDSDDSALTYMLARIPSRGELQRAGVTVDKFSQQDVLQGHIYYAHTGGEIGPEPVFDTVTLIISDSEARGPDSCCHGEAPPPPVPLHGTLPVYDLNITVLPVNDKVPAVTLGESMLVVDEGSSICLCGGVLGASDPDSPPEQLVFHLETPPLHGFLENTQPMPGSEKSNAGVRVESFTLTHLTSGFINYVQSEHKGVEPTVDQLSISVSDGLHRSAPVPFYIIIKPTNDETPSLLLANFTVKEGGMRELIPSILDGFDLDAPPDLLTFTVVQPPAHGSLINSIHGTEAGADLLHRSLSVTSFTLQELRQGMRIVYMHDDTETLKDAVALRLTDGVHAVEGTVQVTVLLVNDEKPRLLKNAGLQVDSGELRVISSVVLEAEDLDTPPEQVYYFLNVAPRFGKLQLKTTSGWNELTAGQNFTQGDVEMNRLWYQHTAATNAAGFKGHDSFRFTLSDLDNESPAQIFFISVHVVQKGDVVVLSRPVHLREGQRVVLNTDILLASDSTGRPEELVYTVSDPPRHGLVHAVHRPGVPLLSFTQLDVAAHRVCYTHDNSHDAEADSFSFVVTNGDSSRSSTLHFTIEHGDRIPPTLSRNVGLRLQDGSTVTITSDQLQLTDPDTTTANLGYVITQLPQRGKLLLRGTPLPSPPRFSQTDVDDLHLTYQHDPSTPAKIDGFYFMPGDGHNRGYLEFGQLREEPAVFDIQVDWVDRTPPTLTTRGSPSTVVDLGGGRYGILITSRELQASDPDSPTEELEFSISRPPHLGYLENAATGSYIKGRFTQRDVDRRAVMFVLPADVEVTSDSFLFVLRDPAGNSALPQTLELSWSRVELSATCYRTCETAGTLQIHVQRSGRSADPAYVAIQPTPPPLPPQLPDPLQPEEEEEVPVINIEAELLWENQPHPPRGDVPNRHHLDYKEVEPRDPEPHSNGYTPHSSHLNIQQHTGSSTGNTGSTVRLSAQRGPEDEQEKVWTFHSLTPLRLEELQPGDVEWSWSAHGRPLQELQVGDSPQMAHQAQKHQLELRQHKVGKSVSSSCPDGWTHHRRRCYILSPSVASWASADRTCSLLFNSSLTDVHSRRDVSWLWRFAGKKPFWIGLSGGPGRSSWADSRSLSSSRLRGAPVSPSEPENDSNCVLVQNPRSWISTSCSAETQHSFICSSPAQTH